MELELTRRLADLAARCERQSVVTATAFLTPAEQRTAERFGANAGCALLLHGGADDCERRVAFFLPFYLAPEDFDPAEYLRAVRVTASFGRPGHRDYLGALLALGVRREWLGDVRVAEDTAHVFCLPSVAAQLCTLTHVGRCGVKTAQVPLADVPAQARTVKAVSFTVQSLRLDAVLAGLFGLSRTAAADAVRAGQAKLNDAECLRPDAPVRPGDTLSLRGCGKGALVSLGGASRKGRQFVAAERWL